MHRYMSALEGYIKQGLVSISSMALQGHDDVAGLAGVYVHVSLEVST
jgi:hypothetical protein